MSLFDDEEFAPAAEAEEITEDRMAESGNYTTDPEPVYDVLDQQIEEGEARLKEVGYYRSLTTADIFGSEGEDPIADRVQRNIANFARQEMAAILNGKSQQDQSADPGAERLRYLGLKLADDDVKVLVEFFSGWTKEEASVLRGFVVRVMKDPTILRMFLTPKVNKVTQAEPEPVAKPAPRIAPKPAVRPIQAAPARTNPLSAARPPTKPPQRTPAKPAPKAPAKPTQPRLIPKKPSAKAAPVAPETPPQSTEPAKLKSPHSKPFPTNSEFASATARQAERAAAPGLTNRLMARDMQESMAANALKNPEE